MRWTAKEAIEKWPSTEQVLLLSSGPSRRWRRGGSGEPSTPARWGGFRGERQWRVESFVSCWREGINLTPHCVIIQRRRKNYCSLEQSTAHKRRPKWWPWHYQNHSQIHTNCISSWNAQLFFCKDSIFLEGLHITAAETRRKNNGELTVEERYLHLAEDLIQ